MSEIRELSIPRFKKDWPGKTLLMKEDSPVQRGNSYWGFKPSLVKKGDTVTIQRFISRQEGLSFEKTLVREWIESGQRVLQIVWLCPVCGTHHTDYLPESFIREQKAIFIEIAKEDERRA